MVGQLAESAGVATLIENGELTLENGEHLSLSAGSGGLCMPPHRLALNSREYGEKNSCMTA